MLHIVPANDKASWLIAAYEVWNDGSMSIPAKPYMIGNIEQWGEEADARWEIYYDTLHRTCYSWDETVSWLEAAAREPDGLDCSWKNRSEFDEYMTLHYLEGYVTETVARALGGRVEEAYELNDISIFVRDGHWWFEQENAGDLVAMGISPREVESEVERFMDLHGIEKLDAPRDLAWKAVVAVKQAPSPAPGSIKPPKI